MALATLGAGDVILAQPTLVPVGATWRYRKGTNEVSNPLPAWRALGFDARTWATGAAPFHFGDGLTTGTMLDDMRGQYTSVFLRREFAVTKPAEITALQVLVDYDDGFVAWINGVEVARNGVVGEPRFNSTATSSHEGGSWVAFPAAAPASFLVDGTNVIAVLAFNRDLSNSTDFRIHVALEAERHDATPPQVAGYDPLGPEVASLTQVTVVFTKPVIGVAAGDLLVNEEPATSLVGASGSDRYSFRFAEPAPGPVNVTWNDANRILDLHGNPFNTEDVASSWSYVLRDTEGPEIRQRTPVAGATVSRLDQIELIFSEPVSGLESPDLLVNGEPATAVEGTDAGPYVIRFPTPAPGRVEFSWAAGHGVSDTAPGRNAFAGAGWAVTLEPALGAGDVVLNEIMAANDTGLRDEDGEPQDWIELHNRGAVAVELLGWSLTDDRGAPGKWTFPSRRLAPGEYLVVFASGKDRRLVTGANRLHTNFKLSTFGEPLALHDAASPRSVVAAFDPSYPEQRTDISYGQRGEDAWGYFTRPTPGAPNGASTVVGVAPEPHFSVGRGTFDRPFNVLLTTPLDGASIRYTLDGSEPSASSGLLYTAPLHITNTTIVRAATFRDGYLPSRVGTHSYLFLGDVMTQPDRPPGFPATWGTWNGFPNNQVPADYEMDLDPLRTDPNNPASPLDPAKVARLQAGLRELPVVSLVMRRDDMFGPNGLYPRASDSNKAANEKPCSVEMLLPDGTTAFVTEGGLDLHGNASRSPLKNPKHGFKLSFKSDYGPTTLRYRLFPDSPATEFDDLVLRPDFNSSWRHWSDNRGNGNGAFQRSRGTRTRFAWSQETFRGMGHVAPHTQYFHLFINGLYWGTYDFSEQPNVQFAADYYEGGAGEHDIYDQGALRQGTSAAYNAMLGLGGLNTLAGYERMRQYLDLPEFMDYMLLHFYVGHQDWGNAKNWYAVRPRVDGPAGTFKYLPWDQECILLEENVNRVPNGGGGDDVPSGLHTKLQDNPQYRLDFADRVFKHLIAPGGALTADANITRWRQWQALLDNPIVAESCRWGDYRRDVHRYSDGTYDLYTREQHWLAENQRLVNSYFVNRGDIVLGQLRAAGLYPNLETPLFSQSGGRVAAGFALRLSAPAGTIYYTLDGSDPRVYGSGAVASEALTYDEPITLERTLTLRARVWQNGTWSALNEATFLVEELGLPIRFTEIMYHPPGGDAYEFIELQNVGSLPLEVSGFSVRGVEFVFPDGTIIAPGALVIVVSEANLPSFQARYPGAVVLGVFRGSLDNAGERLAVVDHDGGTVTTVHYDDEGGWPAEADGVGFSLELVDPRGDPNAPANWRASTQSLGSPGFLPAPPPRPAVVLSEVMADNRSAVAEGTAFPDWIELHNSGAAPVQLDNWSLTDNSDPRRYVFPPGTTLPAGGYVVVWCDSNQTAPGLHAGFALGRQGETVRLFDAATNCADALTFGRQVPDLTMGRLGDTWELTRPTPGATNVAATLASPTNLAINEWLAAPEAGGEDWIELYNRSQTAPVRLQGLYLGTHAALDCLAALAFLEPGGYLELVADEGPGVDHLQFKLPAAGGDIALYDQTGRALDRVAYAAQSQAVSEGRFPDGTTTIRGFAGSVSPGAANYLPDYRGPVLNEVLARNRRSTVAPWGDYADWIELDNPGGSVAQLGGMTLGRAGSPAAYWVIPANVTIPPQGHLLVWCDGSRAASTSAGDGATLNTGFSLDGASGELTLYNALEQAVDSISYGFQIPDFTVGREGSQWRLLQSPTPGTLNSPAAALGPPTTLRINEWMAGLPDGGDWFELHNAGALPVELGGLFLTDDPSVAGITRTRLAPLSFVGPRGWVRFEADGDPSLGRNHVGFRLERDGETLRLYDADRRLLEAVDYGRQIPGVAEGRLPDGAARIVSFPGTDSPEAANYQALPQVVISEVLSHADPPFEDAIELQNLGTQPALVGGWYLSDDPTDLKRYRIPDGTRLDPGGYRVFYLADFGPADGEADAPPRFALNAAHGEAVYLSEADAVGNLTGRRSDVAFGAAANGVSFGRHVTSVAVEFVAQSQRSFGQDNPQNVAQFRTGGGLPNSGPRIGPVVITELMYQPDPAAGGSAGDANLEFLELHNLSSAPVPLFDPAWPVNTWRLDNAVTYQFAAGTTIPPGACLVVVAFDPVGDPSALAAFRATYGSTGTVVGPWSGRLANEGETIELLRPDSPQPGSRPDAGFVPYLLVDRVRFSNQAPWPAQASGTGASLQRINADTYGNDPVHWVAARPTPGWLAGAAATDTDGDGLPDDWEREQGTNPAVADAADDPDGDGMSNRGEFLAGTDPQSAASLLALRVTRISGGIVTLEFSTVANRSYTVLRRDDLGDAGWVRFEEVPAAGDDKLVTVTDTLPASGKRFYQLLTLGGSSR